MCLKWNLRYGPVHILSCAAANQSCLVAIWTAHHLRAEPAVERHLVSVFAVKCTSLSLILEWGGGGGGEGGGGRYIALVDIFFFPGPQWDITGSFGYIETIQMLPCSRVNRLTKYFNDKLHMMLLFLFVLY